MEQNCLHVEVCPRIIDQAAGSNKQRIDYTFKPVKMNDTPKKDCHIIPMCVDVKPQPTK